MRAERRQNPDNPERDIGFACLPHPASGPCIPSRVGPSMSARTAPSKCLPMTPST
jgi:hypothetical protein